MWWILGATTDIALWTDIEVGLGIFASCLATLRPLLRVMLNKSEQSHRQSDRLPSNNPFERNFIEQGAGGAGKFRPNNIGITLATVHTTAGGYDNGSDDHLNRPLPIHNAKQEYMAPKSFEVTITESVPLEHV